MDNLVWHCIDCGAREKVQPTGDEGDEYGIGDHEPCIDCVGGTAHVMSVAMAARFEGLRALGASRDAAWQIVREVRRG